MNKPKVNTQYSYQLTVKATKTLFPNLFTKTKQEKLQQGHQNPLRRGEYNITPRSWTHLVHLGIYTMLGYTLLQSGPNEYVFRVERTRITHTDST